MAACKRLGNFYRFINNLSITPLCRSTLLNENGFLAQQKPNNGKYFHTTVRNNSLMEFFDSEENWGKESVKVGRSWKLDELRIKSNSDLHKLWFVLLKEKNMLLTMEHAYKEEYLPMPNPERIHKVNESMNNIETVVRERNKAYYELETGETGERLVMEDRNFFGLNTKRKLQEYIIPKEENLIHQYRRSYRHRNIFDRDVVEFLKKFNEKINNKNLWKQKMRYNHVCGLFRRFENVDEEAIMAEFPDVDIEKAKRDSKSRGPRLNKY